MAKGKEKGHELPGRAMVLNKGEAEGRLWEGRGALGWKKRLCFCNGERKKGREPFK